jgi:hypothetical protein
MKLKFSILSIFAAGVLFSSCEPRDTKITRPDTRVNPNGGPSTPGVQINGERDNYKYIAMIADRQVEAIELLRAVTDAQFAQAKNIVIEEGPEIAAGVKTKKVSTKVVLKDAKQNESTRDVALSVVVTADENGQVKKIEASEIKEKLSFEKAVKVDVKTAAKIDLSLKNKSKRIRIEKADDASWNVSVELQEQINVKTGKTLMLNAVKFNFAAVDANQDVFKISNVKMNHERYGVDASDFEMVSDANTTMTVELRTADKCVTVSGVLDLDSTIRKKDNSGPVYERTLTYDQSSVSVKSGKDSYTLPALDCDARPSVDLRKIF